MSFTSIDQYTFQDFKSGGNAPFFKVSSLQVDTYCLAHKNEISDHYKIYWIEDGSGVYQIDFNEFRIEGSGIFCLSPGQVFSIKSEQVKSAYQIEFDRDFYCVETHGKEIACNGLLFNNVHRATVISVKEQDKPIFQSFIYQMIAELKNRGSAHQELLESYLRLFLIHTLRLANTPESEQTTIPHQQDRLAQDFIALVEKHFKSEHSVAGYAEKLFVSPKSLSKRLNALSYPTPLQIIKNRIILEAKRQLKFSQKAIKEIAHELGFNDSSYFSRFFSKNAGVSPVAYRKPGNPDDL